MSPFILSFSGNTELHVCTFFLNSGFLTGKCTQVIQFSATNFTNFVDSDAVDSRRFQWEDTFNTHCSYRDLKF